MRATYLISAVFFTVSAAAHEGVHNETNAHTTGGLGGADPVAVAAIVVGVAIVLGLAWYAVRDHRNRPKTG